MKKGFLFLKLLIIFMFISVPLTKLFANLQYSLFRSETDIIFMHSKITNAIVAVGLLICLAVFWFMHNSKLNSKKWIIVLILFCITLIASFIDIFSYSAINDTEITIRTNIVEEAKHYEWADVISAKTDYSYGKDKFGNKFVIFEFYLILNDGNKISFRNSEEFRSYDKVLNITEFLNNKEVRIVKSDINTEDLYLLIDNYNDEYGQNTEKMFRNLYKVVN